MLDVRWCACIKPVFRHLLAGVVRAALPRHAVNTRVRRLKNMGFVAAL